MTDLRLIIETAAALDDMIGRIHRACEIPAGKDGRTVLQRMRDDATANIRAARYDPPSGVYRPPSDDELEQRKQDPEALTPPIRSDPTGEAAIRKKGPDPLKRVQDNLDHMLKVAERTIDLLAANLPHKPTAEELAAAKEVEAANKPADHCQNCIRAGFDVPTDGALFTNLADGIEDLRICGFCKAHALLGTCPNCGPKPGLPTKAECKMHHTIEKKRMSA